MKIHSKCLSLILELPSKLNQSQLKRLLRLKKPLLRRLKLLLKEKRVREAVEAAVVVEEAEAKEALGEALMVKKDQREEEDVVLGEALTAKKDQREEEVEVVKEVPGEVPMVKKEEEVTEGEVIEEEVKEGEETGEEETLASMPKDLKLSKLVEIEIPEGEAVEEVPGEVLTAKREEEVTEVEEPRVVREVEKDHKLAEEEERDHQEEELAKVEIFLELPLPQLDQLRLRNER